MKISGWGVAAALALCAGCSGITDTYAARDKEFRAAAVAQASADEPIVRAREGAITDFVAGLSLTEQISQLFMINLEGAVRYRAVETFAGKPLMPGGYLFFSYNVGSTPEQVIVFTDSIRDFCVRNGRIMPFLAVDQEGGEVNRLRGVTGRLPSAGDVAEKLSVPAAYKLYALQARQLRALGFTMNLAPVAEVLTIDNRAFLGTRSFGGLSRVQAYGAAAVNAFQNAGVAATVKHFPGNTNTDPHTGFPEIAWTQAELDAYAFAPFAWITAYHPSGLLLSHARTQAIDPKIPAALSAVWARDMAREKLQFDGLIFSDDIFMTALMRLGYPPETIAIRAIESGVNCIMISEKKFGGNLRNVLTYAEKNPEFAELIRASCERVIRAKIDFSLLTVTVTDDDAEICRTGNLPAAAEERLQRFYRARDANAALCDEAFAE